METKNGKDSAEPKGDGKLPGELRLLLNNRFGADVEPKLFAQSDVTAAGRFGRVWQYLRAKLLWVD
jgi:hypothetical protein